MIPRSELIIDFARSGGPGGQNVNKTATKAVARWSVGQSRGFTNFQKNKIRQALRNRLNSQDEIIVNASAERSQAQNKNNAIMRLNALVRQALVVKKSRRKTLPPRAARERRLEHKQKHSRQKQSRRVAALEW